MCSFRACHMWLTRDHMFIREIWGKFTSFIFWSFVISRLKRGRFQNFKKVNSVNLFQISLLNMWLLVHILRLNYDFKKLVHSFIDLGLYFDLCENESYSTFVQKVGFFYARKSIYKTLNFSQIENVWESALSHLHIKTKMSFITFVNKKLLRFIAQLSLILRQTLVRG